MVRRVVLSACCIVAAFLSYPVNSVQAGAPGAPTFTTLADGRVLVGFDSDELAFEADYLTTIGSVGTGFRAPAPLAGFPVGHSKFVSVGAGVFGVFNELAVFSTGAEKDPYFSAPAAIWATTIAGNGALGAGRRLAVNRRDPVGVPVVAAASDGSTFIAWSHPRIGRLDASRIVRRAANGVWGKPRRLGPPGFAVSDLVALNGRRVVAVGSDRRGYVTALVGRRVRRLGPRLRSSGSPPKVAGDRRAGVMISWQWDGVVRGARLSPTGRLIRTKVLGRGNTDTAVAMDQRGRSLVVYRPEGVIAGRVVLGRVQAVAIDHQGRITRSVRLEHQPGSVSTLDVAIIDAQGKAAVLWEHRLNPGGVRAQLAFGATNARFDAPHEIGGASIDERRPAMEVQRDGSLFVGWRETPDDHGSVWVQRWTLDGGEPPILVYSR